MKTMKDMPEHSRPREKLRKMVLVEPNRELVAWMEAKIQARLAEIWGEKKRSNHRTPEHSSIEFIRNSIFLRKKLTFYYCVV
jgi:hypothetical protein